MPVVLGTSGYSYKDWIGPFYPEGTRQEEMLGLYAGRFGAVELNFSYYAVPRPATLQKMAERVGPDFRFTLKLHRSLTHEREAAAATVPAFQEAVRPLTESGKLACLLAQFPYSFTGTRENCRHVLWLAERFSPAPLAVEFRHQSWDREEIAPWLARHGLALASVDLPQLEGLPASGARLADPSLAYVRFHGRNRRTWFKHEESYQRYQYSYSEAELSEWVPRVADLTSRAAVVYVFFNNHFEGQAARNAEQFRVLLKTAGLL